jgi:uncharacterized protein (DUF983 family)
MAEIRWQPKRDKTPAAWPMPPLGTALGRGFICRCPSCGKTHLFNGYLTVVRACSVCAAPLGAARADDAPPYFTILIVGHIVVTLMLWIVMHYDPSTTVLTAVFVPLTLVLTLVLLRPIKGATVGLMLKLGMVKADGET